jgi:hypothetical protein
MRIVIEHDNGDEDELFNSIDELLDELADSASEDYADKVVHHLNLKETRFAIYNADELDTYIIQPE